MLLKQDHEQKKKNIMFYFIGKASQKIFEQWWLIHSLFCLHYLETINRIHSKYKILVSKILESLTVGLFKNNYIISILKTVTVETELVNLQCLIFITC